jgi:membrane protein
VWDAVRAARGNGVTDAAAAITYYAFTALPATVMASAGLAVLIGGARFVNAIVARASTVLPADVVSVLQGTLTRAVEDRRGSVVFTVVGIVVAVWGATGAMSAVMRGLNRLGGPHDRAGRHRDGGLVGGPVAAARSRSRGGDRSDAGAGTGPSPERRPRHARPGRHGPRLDRGLTALLPLVASFSSYNKAWGSLSAVVVTIVWMWLGAMALLLGAEVDARVSGD